MSLIIKLIKKDFYGMNCHLAYSRCNTYRKQDESFTKHLLTSTNDLLIRIIKFELRCDLSISRQLVGCFYHLNYLSFIYSSIETACRSVFILYMRSISNFLKKTKSTKGYELIIKLFK